MIDVTEQRQLAAVRDQAARDHAALAGRLISIQDDERQRIARDLHDNIGQQVTGLRLKLDTMAMTGDLDTVRQCLTDAQQTVDELDRALDFIAANLRPAALDLGLVTALQQFVREWSATFDIPVDVHVGSVRHLHTPPEVETHLYRIAQEALHNVYKHAKATAVSVILERRADRLVLIVEDNGEGFKDRRHGTENKDRGLGLVGIRERATLMHGTAEIESAPGKGTTVFVQVPNAFHRSASKA